MDPGSPPPAGGFVRDDKCGDKSEKIFIMKKTLKIGGIILGVVLFLFVILVIYFNNQIKKGEIFMYEGRWWKKDDWVKIYDPYSIDTPEKNTEIHLRKKLKKMGVWLNWAMFIQLILNVF